jgi:hypothetical protein
VSREDTLLGYSPAEVKESAREYVAHDDKGLVVCVTPDGDAVIIGTEGDHTRRVGAVLGVVL